MITKLIRVLNNAQVIPDIPTYVTHDAIGKHINGILSFYSSHKILLFLYHETLD